MKLPSRIVDISQPLDNDTVVDPPFMRPSIRYVTGKENAKLMVLQIRAVLMLWHRSTL